MAHGGCGELSPVRIHPFMQSGGQGGEEGAVVGYNPKKPGRPSHCYHTYSMAGTRLVLEVDVSAGDEHTSNHSAPGLWAFLDRTPRDCWPSLLRGDKGFGNEGIMREAERRALARRPSALLDLGLASDVLFVSADAKIEAGDFHRGEAKMGEFVRS